MNSKKTFFKKLYRIGSLTLAGATTFFAVACGAKDITNNTDISIGKLVNKNSDFDFNLFGEHEIITGDHIAFKGDAPYTFSNNAKISSAVIKNISVTFTLEEGWHYEVLSIESEDNTEAVKIYKSENERDNRYMLIQISDFPFGMCGTGLTERDTVTDNNEPISIAYFDNYTEWAVITFTNHKNISILNSGLINDDAITAIGMAKTICFSEGTEADFPTSLTDSDGCSYSATTLLITFDQKKSDEELAVFCSSHNFKLIYSYDIIPGIAVKLPAPANNPDEMNRIINDISKDSSVVSVEKDYLVFLDSSNNYLQ